MCKEYVFGIISLLIVRRQIRPCYYVEDEMDFTHFNKDGYARMVDVTDKEVTLREAVARGTVYMNEDTIRAITDGKIKKGDVLSVAQVAGIMAAKKTSDVIPMCHPIMITGVDITFEVKETEIDIQSTVRCKGETGVEMEALTAVSVAALTIYDMCKSVQRDIVIGEIGLLEKSGGKSGHYKRG